MKQSLVVQSLKGCLDILEMLKDPAMLVSSLHDLNNAVREITVEEFDLTVSLLLRLKRRSTLLSVRLLLHEQNTDCSCCLACLANAEIPEEPDFAAVEESGTVLTDCLGQIVCSSYLNFSADPSLSSALLSGTLALAKGNRINPKIKVVYAEKAAKLLREMHRVSLVKSLFDIQRRAAGTDARWLGVLAAHLLSQVLVESNGVRTILTAVTDENSTLSSGKVDHAFVDKFALVLAKLPRGYANRPDVYYASVCKQALQLILVGEESWTYILAAFIDHLLTLNSKVAEQFLIPDLFGLFEQKSVPYSDELSARLSRLTVLAKSTSSRSKLFHELLRRFPLYFSVFETLCEDNASLVGCQDKTVEFISVLLKSSSLNEAVSVILFWISGDVFLPGERVASFVYAEGSVSSSLAGTGRAAVLIRFLEQSRANWLILPLLKAAVERITVSENYTNSDCHKMENPILDRSLLEAEEEMDVSETRLAFVTLVAGILQEFEEHLISQRPTEILKLAQTWLTIYTSNARGLLDTDAGVATLKLMSGLIASTVATACELPTTSAQADSIDSLIPPSLCKQLISSLETVLKGCRRADGRLAIAELLLVLRSLSSLPENTQIPDEIRAQNDLSPVDRELRNLDDPVPAMKGHALIALAGMLKTGDTDARKRWHEIFDSVVAQLSHTDSYVYLSAINALEAASALVTSEGLQRLLNELDHSQQREVEYRVRLAEVVAKVISTQGDLTPHYVDTIVSHFLPLTSAGDPLLTASSLSTIGNVLERASFRIETCLHEMLSTIQAVFSSPSAKDLERRAAVHLLRQLLEGCSQHKFEPLADDLLRLYRLVQAGARDADTTVQLHASVCKQIIDETMFDLLTEIGEIAHRVVLK